MRLRIVRMGKTKRFEFYKFKRDLYPILEIEIHEERPTHRHSTPGYRVIYRTQKEEFLGAHPTDQKKAFNKTRLALKLKTDPKFRETYFRLKGQKLGNGDLKGKSSPVAILGGAKFQQLNNGHFPVISPLFIKNQAKSKKP
jgi:hypothetical protein